MTCSTVTRIRKSAKHWPMYPITTLMRKKMSGERSAESIITTNRTKIRAIVKVTGQKREASGVVLVSISTTLSSWYLLSLFLISSSRVFSRP